MPSRRARTTTTTPTGGGRTTTTRDIVRALRRDMAHHLGFRSSRAFQRWEDEIVVDHFANFVCDYMAHGYTVVPDQDQFAAQAERDLAGAIATRVAMLEQAQFQTVLDPDKGEWTAEDHYKHFVVGVVADDVWLHMHDVPCAKLHKRQWSPKETALKMFDLLEFLIWEWRQGAGNGADGSRVKDGLVQVSVREL